jgi:hypothetical protein
MPAPIIVSRHPGAWEWLAKTLGGQLRRKRVGGTPYVAFIRFNRSAADRLNRQWREECGWTFSGLTLQPPDGLVWTDTSDHVGIGIVPGATPDMVRGRIVYGNLPLALCSLATCVYSIEFTRSAHRGDEWTAETMEFAGAQLTGYRVTRTNAMAECDCGG